MNLHDPIAQAFYFGLATVIALWVAHLLTEQPADGGPTRLSRLVLGIQSRYVVYDQADDDQVQTDQADDDQAENLENRNDETAKDSTPTAKDDRNNNFQFPDAFGLAARLVAAELITEGDVLKVGFRVSAGSSKKYKAARAALTTAQLALPLENFPPLSDEQKATRARLGLDKTS